MSKRFKGKTCVYCLEEEASETGDHVVCRAFFRPQDRADLPQVPACRVCNKEKSDLEHYLATVLPFGGRHDAARPTMEELLPGRLTKNLKLARELSDRMQPVLVSSDGSPWELGGTLPLDGEKLVALFAFIVRGLAFHHWGMLLAKEDIVLAGFLSASEFEGLLATNGSCISMDLGNGVFVYEALRSGGHPKLSFWKMSLYGVEMSDPKAKGVRIKYAYGATAPNELPAAAALASLFGRTKDDRKTGMHSSPLPE